MHRTQLVSRILLVVFFGLLAFAIILFCVYLGTFLTEYSSGVRWDNEGREFFIEVLSIPLKLLAASFAIFIMRVVYERFFADEDQNIEERTRVIGEEVAEAVEVLKSLDLKVDAKMKVDEPRDVRSSKSSKRPRGKEMIEERATRYVAAILNKRKSKLSQNELEEIAVLDQTSWSRYLGSKPFLECAIGKLKDYHELKGFIPGAIADLEQRLEKVQERNFNLKKPDPRTQHSSDQRVEPEGDENIDLAALAGMTEPDIINEILENQPSLKKSELQQRTRAQLIRIFLSTR